MPHPDHEKNRAAWNEMVGIHYDHPDYRTKEFLEGHSKLMPIERSALGDVRGKTLLHLMCQFGLDTLSWAREGAIVTGVDISDESIRRAEQLAREAKLSAMFVRSDVLDLIGVIDGQFDIVFQSYGTYMWISDIQKWGKVVGHYLKPGGVFFIADTHPARPMFYDPPISYFATSPDRATGVPDYCDRDYKIKNELVEWQHPLSEIINSLIDAGLTIEHLGEYNKMYYAEESDWVRGSDGYWTPPSGPTPYPLMFSLKARKR
ncbi:MAG: class I SAM-dependent methyltransferase [candidate division Zixibacteria bacterium]|nr:class I SAM-dependent methyltransferase [candidate division Zixibacteria bacterium]